MLYWVATRGKGGKDVGMGGPNQAAAPVPTIATHQLDAHHKSRGGGPGGDGIPASGWIPDLGHPQYHKSSQNDDFR